MGVTFILVILGIVLVGAFKEAGSRKHPVLIRAMLVVIALGLVAVTWYSVRTLPERLDGKGTWVSQSQTN